MLLLELPEPYPQWRFYRLLLPMGRMMHIRDQIHTQEQLQGFFNKLNPTDCYNSVAYYCDPSNVSFNDFAGKRAGYQQAYNLLLNGDLVFDIDARNRSLTRAKSDALICHDWLGEMGLDAKVIFSGRGFHLRVTKHDLELKESSPQKRLREYRKIREPFVKELAKRGVQIDAEVTLNPKGLIRLVGSINSKTGTVVTTIHSLEQFNAEGVERVSAGETSSPATPGKGNDDNLISRENRDSLTGQWLSEQANTPTFLFVGTRVIGTINRHVLLLRFPLETPLCEIHERIMRLLTEEPLAPFFLFESLMYDQAYYAISPSAVEQTHIPHLLKAFPEARAGYRKFGHRILPLPVVFISKIGDENFRAVVSRPHSEFLKNLVHGEPQGTRCGGWLVRIGLARFKIGFESTPKS